MDYFFTSTNDFGPLAWIFFVLQIAIALAGVYLGFIRSESRGPRGVALRQLGYVLLGFGFAGVLVAALRLSLISPFTVRAWFYAIVILELALAAYAVYYAQVVLPKLVAAQTVASRRGGQRVLASNRSQNAPVRTSVSPSQISAEQSSAAARESTRREARRERKRRKK